MIDTDATGQATIERRRRPPLSETPDSIALGDDAFTAFDLALEKALERVVTRHCKQQVRRDAVNQWGEGLWLVQDVR